MERSAEWLRAKCEAASDIHESICQAAVHSEEAMGIAYTWSDAAEAASDYEDHYRALLAAAEAREAGQRAGVGVPSDSTQVVENTSTGGGVEAAQPTAAEVIAAAERALEKLLRSTNTIEVLGEYEALEINAGSRRTMRAHVDAVTQESRDALAAIATWKEAQRG